MATGVKKSPKKKAVAVGREILIRSKYIPYKIGRVRLRSLFVIYNVIRIDHFLHNYYASAISYGIHFLSISEISRNFSNDTPVFFQESDLFSF